MRCLKSFSFLAVAVILMFSLPSRAEEFGTKAEAEALVKKTVAALKKDGIEKVSAAVIAKDAAYVDRDLYPVIYDGEGKVIIAHGANQKMVGKDTSDVIDSDGKPYGQERSEKAKTMKTFWIEYKYKNPANNKIDPKEMYCEKTDANLVCAGAYKR